MSPEDSEGKIKAIKTGPNLNSALTSLCVSSSSDILKKQDMSALFLITITMVGVERKTTKTNNSILTAHFISAKIEVHSLKRNKEIKL